MKTRGLVLIGAGVVVTGLAIVLLIGHWPWESRVCPAIGYANTGSVELTFSTPPDTVSACFGDGCTPAPVARNGEGKWLVPQSSPYLDPPVGVTSIYLEAQTASHAQVAKTFPIETESTGEYPYGPDCGGPFRFKPVQVDFS